MDRGGDAQGAYPSPRRVLFGAVDARIARELGGAQGLGANHVSKVMSPDKDHLSFYRVGGPAADASSPRVATGAVEDLVRGGGEAATAAARMGMAAAGDLGRGGRTGYLTAVRVGATAAAHIHSLAVGEDGRCFAWGCGSNGRLGLRALMRGPAGAKRALKCYVSTPSGVEALEGRRVVAAAAGRFWSLFIVADEVLTLGAAGVAGRMEGTAAA